MMKTNTNFRLKFQKVNYAALCGDDSDSNGPSMEAGKSNFISDDEEELFDNTGPSELSHDVSNDLFDSLKATDEDSPVKKPAKRKLGAKAEVVKPPAAKRGGAKKKVIISDSDESPKKVFFKEVILRGGSLNQNYVFPFSRHPSERRRS